MTEAEWLTCTDPQPMLAFLKGKTSERKLRLFAVACARSSWDLLVDQRSRNAVEVSERFADAHDNSDTLESAYREAWDAVPFASSDLHVIAARAAARTAQPDSHKASCHAADEIVELQAWSAEDAEFDEKEGDKAYQRGKATAEWMVAALLRDIMGNPFRPVSVQPSCLTPAVVGLAESIYNDLGFDRISELDDALEAAGCTNAEVIDHCRGSGPHARGCWVLDLILEKK
jgi:hypothetical protein